MTMTQSLTLSCEFFPPRTDEGMKNFRAAREQLLPLKPAFFSVTFGFKIGAIPSLATVTLKLGLSVTYY